MARANGPTPVMDRVEKATKAPRRHAGPYGASFDGTDPAGKPTKGLTFERRWTTPGHPPLRRDHLGVPDRRHQHRDRQERLRAEGRRGPELLVAARHQRRGQQVLPRPPQHPGARDQRPPAHRPGRQHDRRPGPRPSATSRRDEDLATFKAELTHLLVHQKMAFNSPVWFNVGIEEKPQCSACFINSVAGLDVVDHGPRQDRGHALQVRLGRGLQPEHDPRAPRRRCRAAAPPPARSAS